MGVVEGFVLELLASKVFEVLLAKRDADPNWAAAIVANLEGGDLQLEESEVEALKRWLDRGDVWGVLAASGTRGAADAAARLTATLQYELGVTGDEGLQRVEEIVRGVVSDLVTVSAPEVAATVATFRSLKADTTDLLAGQAVMFDVLLEIQDRVGDQGDVPGPVDWTNLTDVGIARELLKRAGSHSQLIEIYETMDFPSAVWPAWAPHEAEEIATIWARPELRFADPDAEAATSGFLTALEALLDYGENHIAPARGGDSLHMISGHQSPEKDEAVAARLNSLKADAIRTHRHMVEEATRVRRSEN